MKILISTDTSCLLKNGMLEKLGISVFPLNVIIDGEEYLDSVTINQEQLCEAMRSGKSIKTSTPAYGIILEYFDKLFEQGYDHIIHFTISSKLSSMYNLFYGISEENYQGKLTVIDSYSLSTGMLNNVLYAYDEVNKGTSIDKIVEEIENRKNTNEIVFIPENLNALKNGGRISPAIAAIANTIGIKPLIVLEDGALEKDKMIKNVKNALFERFAKALETKPVEEYDYTLVGFYPKEVVYNNLKNECIKLIREENILEGLIPINVCAHCGPGTIGVLVTKKINNKSIKEFM